MWTRSNANITNKNTPFITKIVNISIRQAYVPTVLKKAVINPLIKKLTLDSQIYKNFRPVSNLCFLSKVIEKVIAMQLIDYIYINKLQLKLQSAYKKYHSTETAILKVSNDILSAIDNKKCVILILLDLSAAFDTIDHDKLLNHLTVNYGIEGMALKWLRSYLTERTQTVKIKDVKSREHTLKCGVPQGSVLGPLLFTMYTSSLGELIQRHGIKYHLYADDTQLYLDVDPHCKTDIKDSLDKLKKCLIEIRSWMIENCLKLNEEKTEILILGTAQHTKLLNISSIDICGKDIRIANSAKNIGFTLDPTLQLSHQVNNVCKTCYYHIRNIWRIRKSLNVESTKTLVHAMVMPRLDFMNSLYFGLKNSEIQKLQKVQNAAARLVVLATRRAHITQHLHDLHWLPVRQRIKYKMILTTYKCLHGMGPDYLIDLLELYKNERNGLRSEDTKLLKEPLSRLTSFGDRAFRTAAPCLWNKLPFSIRDLDSTATFKKKLKTYLFNEHFN